MKPIKTFALALALCLSAPLAVAAPEVPAKMEAAPGEIIVANVNGLVCDFCAQSIRKTIGKEDAVQKVYVDLSNGQVRLDMKPGKTLDDATIETLVRKSGYSLVSIDRNVAK